MILYCTWKYLISVSTVGSSDRRVMSCVPVVRCVIEQWPWILLAGSVAVWNMHMYTHNKQACQLSSVWLLIDIHWVTCVSVHRHLLWQAVAGQSHSFSYVLSLNNCYKVWLWCLILYEASWHLHFEHNSTTLINWQFILQTSVQWHCPVIGEFCVYTLSIRVILT